jgi:hypothetical protein
MINEHTSEAIAIERSWLIQGQPIRSLSTEDCGNGPGKDEYGRPLFVYTSQGPRLSARAANLLAVERARTWAFQCPDVPPKPANFVPAT